MAESIFNFEHLPTGVDAGLVRTASLAVGDGMLRSVGPGLGPGSGDILITTHGAFPGRKVLGYQSAQFFGTWSLVAPHATLPVLGLEVLLAGGVSSDTDLIAFCDAADNVMVALVRNTDGEQHLFANGVDLGEIDLDAGIRMTLELAAYLHTSAGYVLLRADGVEVARFTGIATKDGGHGDCDYIAISAPDANTTGTAPQAWCSEGYTKAGDTDPDAAGIFLGPNFADVLRGTSDIAEEFTPDSGSSNVARVNETASDQDASYIDTASLPVKDEHGIEALPASVEHILACTVAVVSAAPIGGEPSIVLGLKNGSGEVNAAAAVGASPWYGSQARPLMSKPGGGNWTPATAPSSYTVEFE